MKKLLLLSILLCATIAFGQITVSTFAGSGSSAVSNGTGTGASFNQPVAIVRSTGGDFFVADANGNVIRRITPAGVVTTFAGTGTAGGNNGAANVAQFAGPRALAFDSNGNLYVGDTGNYKIRRITPSGVVSDFAGSGSIGGDDGSPSTAAFQTISGIAIDPSNRLYIADGNRVRVVATNGTVSTLAGSGVGSSQNGTGALATFNGVSGIVRASTGDLYVCESSGNRIRKVTELGVVTTLAGSNTAGQTDGTGTAATFRTSVDMTIDNQDNLYVSNQGFGINHLIRKVTLAGVVTTIAGGAQGFADGPAATALFGSPEGMCFDAAGSLYVAEAFNHKIRKLTNVVPQATAPAVTNVNASNVTYNTSTINFNLNSFTSATTYIVEYTTDVLGTWQTQSGGTTSVNTATAFQVQLSNLTPNRRYYVRVKATNAASQVTTSPEIQFDTLRAIVLTNVNDSNVTATTAQINYTLNTNGFSTFVEVRYQAGTFFDTDAPFTTITINNALTNSSAINYNYTITGLTPNTTYSYRIGAAATVGSVDGGENAGFTTSPALSTIDNIQVFKFSVYPNPASAILNIETASEIKSVEIYSLQGQKLLSGKDKQLNIQGLSSGVYMIKVEDENGAIATHKFVKD